MNETPQILTVRQFAEKHPFISQGGIRWLLYSSPQFRSVCARQLGRRVLLVEGEVLKFIMENQKESVNDQETKKRSGGAGASHLGA
jgi:hypothetical protein